MKKNTHPNIMRTTTPHRPQISGTRMPIPNRLGSFELAASGFGCYGANTNQYWNSKNVHPLYTLREDLLLHGIDIHSRAKFSTFLGTNEIVLKNWTQPEIVDNIANLGMCQTSTLLDTKIPKNIWLVVIIGGH